tara:strand:- start:419 stop:574 length:156 start_codon:yes stop_codon:yes gene_type:complete
MRHPDAVLFSPHAFAGALAFTFAVCLGRVAGREGSRLLCDDRREKEAILVR